MLVIRLRKIRDILGEREFQVLVFILSVLLFSLKFLVLGVSEDPGREYMILFGGWAVIIALLFLIGAVGLRDEGGDEEGPGD